MAVMTVVTKMTNLVFAYAPSDARRSTCTPINRKGEKERDKVFENRFVGGRCQADLRHAGGGTRLMKPVNDGYTSTLTECHPLFAPHCD